MLPRMGQFLTSLNKNHNQNYNYYAVCRSHVVPQRQHRAMYNIAGMIFHQKRTMNTLLAYHMQRRSVHAFGSLLSTNESFRSVFLGISPYGYYRNQKPLTTSIITIRNMGGGPRNDEHQERLSAIRKARKIYFKSLPERPPKPPVCTKHYNELLKWKTEPISKKIEHRVIHICSFIVYAWLNAYPQGATIRKLQRDIAFRMQRKHRLPGKLPFQAIMPIVGKLERENFLSIRMKSNGHLLIYRDTDVNIVPDGQTQMDALSKEAEGDQSVDREGEGIDDTDDEERFNIPLPPHEVADVDIEMDEDPNRISRPIPKIQVADVNGTMETDPTVVSYPVPKIQVVDPDRKMETDPSVLSRPMPKIHVVPYEKGKYRPKFSKEQKPKERKVKQKKVKHRSDPIMDPIELPPDTIQTSRGPRFINTGTATSAATTAPTLPMVTSQQESSPPQQSLSSST